MREPSPATANLEEWAGTRGVHPKTASRQGWEGTTPVPRRRGTGHVRVRRAGPIRTGKGRGWWPGPALEGRSSGRWGARSALSGTGEVGGSWPGGEAEEVEVDPSEVDDDPHPHEAGLGTPREPVPVGSPRGQPREGCRLTGRSLPRRRR